MKNNKSLHIYCTKHFVSEMFCMWNVLRSVYYVFVPVENSRPMSDMSMYQEDFQTGAHSARTSGRNKSGPRDLTFQHGPMSRASYLPEGNSLPGREKNRRKRRLNNAWRRQDSQGRSYVTSESDDNMSQVTMMDTGQFFEADQEFVRTQTGSAAALRGIKESNCKYIFFVEHISFLFPWFLLYCSVFLNVWKIYRRLVCLLHSQSLHPFGNSLLSPPPSIQIYSLSPLSLPPPSFPLLSLPFPPILAYILLHNLSPPHPIPSSSSIIKIVLKVTI